MLWSRGEESIDESFPEVLDCIPYLPPGLCIDGEILAWEGGVAVFFKTTEKAWSQTSWAFYPEKTCSFSSL